MAEVLIVGDGGSFHIEKWCRMLSEAGVSTALLNFGQLNKHGTSRRYEGVHVYDYRWIKSRPLIAVPLTLLMLPLLALLVRRHKIVNLHNFDLTTAVLALAAPERSVVTCWGSDVLLGWRSSKGAKKRLLDRALLRARVITTDSVAVEDAIVARFPELKSRIIELAWGIDERKFRMPSITERLQARETFGLPPEAIVFLSNRLVEPLYRIVEIIAAFVQNNTDPRCILLIHSLPGRNVLYRSECGAAANADPRVRFTDRWLDDDELPKLYWSADACLHFPASDASPISMFEAMASGCQVLCSDELPAYASLAGRWKLERLSPAMALSNAGVELVLATSKEHLERNAQLVKDHRSNRGLLSQLETVFQHIRSESK